VRVVKTYGIRRSGLQPAAVRMLLDADLPPEDLASLDFVMSASGPLDPEIRDAFEEALRRPGAVGLRCNRIRRFGVHLDTRVVPRVRCGQADEFRPGAARHRGAHIDPETGEPVPTDHRGLLEAKIARRSDWIRTNDLASVDADGFITLHGRADGRSTAVGSRCCRKRFGACWFHIPRFGTPPWSACPTRGSVSSVRRRRDDSGRPLPAPAELMDLVRDQLPKHCVPVGVAVVDELPRTQSLKVSLRDVARCTDPTEDCAKAAIVLRAGTTIGA
jgi:acyl-CoA synthetase (AMP-forming)/AMP-acid ligase II